ncbi:MAG TPA: pyridoxamine 5'-phosphate oxidase family protein [Actinocrinis sp.]
MAKEPPRSAEQRKKDTLAKLEQEIDVWVATASADGEAFLVPLSYLWDGHTFALSTPEASPTGRNLAAAGRARLGFGPTRDVVMIEGAVESFTVASVPDELADAFAAKHWDSRKESKPYGFYRVTPRTIQAWREENELRGRTIMRDGAWVV